MVDRSPLPVEGQHRAGGQTLARLRLERLRAVMHEQGVAAILTADPINIVYATGVRNMTVFSMMGASRFALILADGPTLLWELAGSEHLGRSSPCVDEVRTAPGITALSGSGYQDAARSFAFEVRDACQHHVGQPTRLAVEHFDHVVTDGLRATGFELTSATDVFVTSRLIKLPAEVMAIRQAVAAVERAIATMRSHIAPGRTEVEVWSHFYQRLIADGGEYVSTRLAQAGNRTFPYFNEAGPNQLCEGDLFAIDTDAIGIDGYAVDLSRTYLCGQGAPTARQQTLHAAAYEQLRHNAANLEPGRSFSDFVSRSWPVPQPFANHRYYCLAHGLGMSGEFPYISVEQGSVRQGGAELVESFQPGMVMCVESYIGDPVSRQGVKLEDQYLITDSGAECLTLTPFDTALSQ